MKIYLPDVNVWVALAFEAHAHHSDVVNWFRQYPESRLVFCRTTHQGFLRIASNVKAIGNDVMTLPQAWDAYDAIMRDPRISFVEEPIDLELHWRTYTGNESYSPKIWTDAYLAAFAYAAEFEIVTLDSGFRRYRNLQLTWLGS